MIRRLGRVLAATGRKLLEAFEAQAAWINPAPLLERVAGAGGMLCGADEHLARLNPQASLAMPGQALDDLSFAICKADMLIKGRNVENIVCGDTLSDDGHPNARFGAGLPRVSAGSLFFLLHLMSRMRLARDGAPVLADAALRCTENVRRRPSAEAPDQGDRTFGFRQRPQSTVFALRR